jgi:hypothetical protein
MTAWPLGMRMMENQRQMGTPYLDWQSVFARAEILAGISAEPKALTPERERWLIWQRRIVNVFIPILSSVAIMAGVGLVQNALPLIELALGISELKEGYEELFRQSLEQLKWPAGISVFGLVFIFLWRARLRTALAGHLVAPDSTPARFGLLLRSFFIDETLRAGSISFFPDVRDYESLELRLERGGGADYRLIKVGSRTTFDLSGGTHRPDLKDNEAWFVDVKRLITGAQHIFMSPIILSRDSGTAREIAHLVEDPNRLDRTYFVCPADRRLRLRRSGRRHVVRVRQLWEESRRLCRTEFGLELPQHASRGAILIRSGDRLVPVVGLLGREWHHPKSLRILFGYQPAPSRALPDAWQYTLAAVWTGLWVPALSGLFAALVFGPPGVESSEPNGTAGFAVAGAMFVVMSTYPLWHKAGLFVSGLKSKVVIHLSYFAGLAISLLLIDRVWIAAKHFMGSMDQSSELAFQILAVSLFIFAPLVGVLGTSWAAMHMSQRNSMIVQTAHHNSTP